MGHSRSIELCPVTSIDIRLASTADAEHIGALVHAMDQHYRGLEGSLGIPSATEMARRCLESNEGTRFLLALESGAPIGIACFAIIRPGRRQHGLVFLKDLFVVDAMRSRGVGATLMRALARFATERGIGRIDLQTATENIGAQKLYDTLGGLRRENVLAYTYEGDALAALAAGKD